MCKAFTKFLGHTHFSLNLNHIPLQHVTCTYTCVSHLPLFQYNDTRHPISVKVAFFFITLAIVLIFLGQFYKWSLTEEGISCCTYYRYILLCETIQGGWNVNVYLRHMSVAFTGNWNLLVSHVPKTYMLCLNFLDYCSNPCAVAKSSANIIR